MSFERIDTTANRLKIAMNNAGKKQIDIVRETGIDKGSMSHYLKGKYEPKQDVIFILAKPTSSASIPVRYSFAYPRR